VFVDVCLLLVDGMIHVVSQDSKIAMAIASRKWQAEISMAATSLLARRTGKYTNKRQKLRKHH